MVRRRIITFAVALSVLWTALWPLVSSAYLAASDQSMPMCHQAGMQVSPDMPPMEMPAADRKPAGDSAPKQHCPLCLMAFLAAFSPPVIAPQPPRADAGAASNTYWAPLPSGIEVQLPQGRAPPSTLVS